MSLVLGAEDQALIESETRLLAAVQAALAQAQRSQPARSTYLRSLDSLREEAAGASEEDLPRLFDQLHNVHSQAATAALQALPDPRAPYFAHLQLRLGERRRDVLLGHQTFAVPGTKAVIVDWRTAPLARLIFDYEPGDEFEEQGPERLLCGVIEQSVCLVVDNGQLVGIDTASRSLRLQSGGRWSVRRVSRPSWSRSARPQGQHASPDVWPPDVSGLLDDKQRAVLAKEDRRPLLILGGAGSGKTTVAVHRVAALHQRDPKRYEPGRMLVVVAEPGLARLIGMMLGRMGLGAVPVHAFDEWAGLQAAQLFADLPRVVRDDAPAAVIRFKRHGALRAQLPWMVEQFGLEMVCRIDRKLVADGQVVSAYDSISGVPLRDRLNKTRDIVCDQLPPAEREQARELFAREAKRLWRSSEWRDRLIGNRPLLERAVAFSDGQLTQDMAEQVLARSRIQLSNRSEASLGHVDADRLRTIDGKGLDEGTLQEAARSIDPEDFALLLEALWLATGSLRTAFGQVPRYRHLVVDEAQELAPVELSVLGHALSRRASVTVSGDRAQQVDPAACFDTWERTLEFLGLVGSESVHLETNYRSTRQIAEFAHRILGDLAPERMPPACVEGAPVQVTQFASEGHAAVELVRGLRDAWSGDRYARIAVIAHDAESSRRWAEILQPSVPVRHVTRGEFSFKPGIDVTDVEQVKGLEFDYVVIPDASANRYPDRPQARRMLHVAATRAIHQLWVLGLGSLSSVVQHARE